MKIKCMKCGHTEKKNNGAIWNRIVGCVNTIIGILGFATMIVPLYPLCGACFALGLVFIVISYIQEWIEKNHSCPDCGSKKWEKV